MLCGWGLVRCRGNSLAHIAHGVVRCGSGPIPGRLKKIHDQLTGVIEQHRPTDLAVESIFFSKNAQSALKLGHARGVALLAGVNAGLPIHEYSPAVVKQALVGNGRAAKEQVSLMVKTLLGLGEAPQADAGDALAVAMCHAMRADSPALG